MLASPLLWLSTSAVALAALWWSTRGRLLPAPRCPRCGYDMSGSSELRCPECSHVALAPGELIGRRRRPLAILLATLAVLASLTLFARAALRSGWQYAVLPTWRTLFSERVGPLTVSTLEVRDPGSPEFMRRIRVSGRHGTLLELDGFHFEVGGSVRVGGAAGRRTAALDVTGDGQPELVITRGTGGSGGESVTLIFGVQDGPGQGLEPLAVLPFPGVFEDLDGDGSLEFVCGDATYRYRWTSGADSPRPRVVLRFDGRRFVVDVDAMRRGAGHPADKAPDSDPQIVPQRLCQAIDLIYQGRGDAALDLLRRAAVGAAGVHGVQNPADAPPLEQAAEPGPVESEKVELDRILGELPEAMQESPFRLELELLNADQPEFLHWLGSASGPKDRTRG